MPDLLDDQSVIQQRDPQGALVFAAEQPQQLTYNFNLNGAHFKDKNITNVVFAGMGGSALAAGFVTTWPGVRVPFVVSKEYSLPAFVNQQTLVICSSYSGNTEETLEALTEAEKLGAHIAIIAHGGTLGERAKVAGHIFVELPECLQPRMGVFYSFRATVELLAVAGLVPQAALDQLAASAEPLASAQRNWLPSVPTDQNLAKQLAYKMLGKTPIVYAGPLLYPAAYKWKIDANENAKNTAWCNFFPELNHNEFIGWSSHPVEKPFAVVDLVSTFEHPRILKRFEVTDRMLSGMRPESIAVTAEGHTILDHLLYTVLLGDFATLYLALLNGVNPTPVDLVEKFKKELG